MNKRARWQPSLSPTAVSVFGLALLGALAAGGAPALTAQEAPSPDRLAAERLAAGFGFAVAGSGLRYRIVAIPDATRAAIVAAVRVGAWHDPPGRTGLAHLLSAQIALTQEGRPEPERWSAKMTGPATVLAITCAREAITPRLQELARFLGGALSFDDDLVARAHAQVRKRIDDFLHVVPGPLLFETARRCVLAGTPAGKQFFGVPAEVEAIGRAEMQAWFQQRVRPEHTTLVVLGGVDEHDVAATCASAFTAPGARTSPAVPTVHDGAGEIVKERAHERVAAPFVTVAIKAPPADSPRWLPFVIAMGIVQLRCQNTFGAYRFREAEAMFPFFWFDYRHGDAFALINRRGASAADAAHGDRERDADAVRGEMRALIKRLRTIAPEVGEVRQAAFEAASSMMLPPYEGQLAAMAQPRNAGLLMPRAELLVMADVLGWRATLQVDIGKVPVLEVHAALASALADDNLTWFALLPKP